MEDFKDEDEDDISVLHSTVAVSYPCKNCIHAAYTYSYTLKSYRSKCSIGKNPRKTGYCKNRAEISFD